MRYQKLVLPAFAAALLLTGCGRDRDDNRTNYGAQTTVTTRRDGLFDDAADGLNDAARDVKDNVRDAARDIKDDAQDAARDAKDNIRDAADDVRDAADDVDGNYRTDDDGRVADTTSATTRNR